MRIIIRFIRSKFGSHSRFFLLFLSNDFSFCCSIIVLVLADPNFRPQNRAREKNNFNLSQWILLHIIFQFLWCFDVFFLLVRFVPLCSLFFSSPCPRHRSTFSGVDHSLSRFFIVDHGFFWGNASIFCGLVGVVGVGWNKKKQSNAERERERALWI